MSNLLLVILLASVVCFVIGLIKPKAFDKLFKGAASRKKTSIAFGVATIVSFVLFGATAPPAPKNQDTPKVAAADSAAPAAAENKPVAPAPQPNPEKPTEVAPPSTATPQEELEKNLRDAVAGSKTSTKMSYRSLKVEKSDPDRPKDTKMITVSVDVGTFLNKSSFLKDTGVLSTQLFEAVYASKLNPYDVFVWYYAKTKDRYGNETDDVVQTYAIDKDTFQKINWQTFDKKSACDFLKQEFTLDPEHSADGCVTLANIK